MDNNMFNEKKQGIIDRIDAAASYALDFNADMDDEQIAIQTNSVSIRLGQAIDAVKELLPPAPPKCAKCNHLAKNLDDEMWCNNEYSVMFENWIYDESFGCTKHSDYEAAK